MDNFLKGLQDVLIARVKNMLLLNFVIAWCIINYDIVMYILFDDMSIDNKILYLKYVPIGIMEGFVFPLLLTAIYIYIIPLLNLWIVIPYNKYVDNRIKNHKNDMLVKHYERQERVERIRLEKTKFLENTIRLEHEEKEKDILAQKNKAKEKENQLKREEVSLKLESNEAKEKENKLKEEEIRLKQTSNEVNNKLKKENEELKKEIEKSERNIEMMEKKKIMLKDDIEALEKESFEKSIRNLPPMLTKDGKIKQPYILNNILVNPNKK